MYIHQLAVTPSSPPALSCMCASLRRAARAVNQLYEEAFRPLGLSTTQFTILQSLSSAGEVTQAVLGNILAMDSTSLTRTLEIMVRRGWVVKRRGSDRREWRIRLSAAGELQLKSALPAWQAAQTQLRSRLGREVFESLLKLTNETTKAVVE